MGIAEVRDAVGRVVADRTTTLLVVEHRVDVWVDLVDRLIVLGPEGVLADGPVDRVLAEQTDALLAAGVWVPGAPLPLVGRTDVPSHGEPLLWIEQLTTGYEPGVLVGRDLDVVIPRGLSTVITGANGSGKSTLALTPAGLLRPLSGRVVAAESLPRPHHRARRSRRTLDPSDPQLDQPRPADRARHGLPTA